MECYGITLFYESPTYFTWDDVRVSLCQQQYGNNSLTNSLKTFLIGKDTRSLWIILWLSQERKIWQIFLKHWSHFDWKSDPRNANFILRDHLTHLGSTYILEAGKSSITPIGKNVKQLQSKDQPKSVKDFKSFCNHGHLFVIISSKNLQRTSYQFMRYNFCKVYAYLLDIIQRNY